MILHLVLCGLELIPYTLKLLLKILNMIVLGLQFFSKLFFFFLELC